MTEVLHALQFLIFFLGGGVKLPCGQWLVDSYTIAMLCSSQMGDEAVANDDNINIMILRFLASDFNSLI